jgi:hypothetical protein
MEDAAKGEPKFGRKWPEMSAPNAKFTRRKEAAIAALLAHPSLARAAEACQTSERTLRRWLQDESFAQRYRQERTRILESTFNLLRQKSVAAVETLANVANDKKASASARVSAARSVVELAIKGAELQDLEQRITELEELAKDRP